MLSLRLLYLPTHSSFNSCRTSFLDVHDSFSRGYHPLKNISHPSHCFTFSAHAHLHSCIDSSSPHKNPAPFITSLHCRQFSWHLVLIQKKKFICNLGLICAFYYLPTTTTHQKSIYLTQLRLPPHIYCYLNWNHWNFFLCSLYLWHRIYCLSTYPYSRYAKIFFSFSMPLSIMHEIVLRP